MAALGGILAMLMMDIVIILAVGIFFLLISGPWCFYIGKEGKSGK